MSKTVAGEVRRALISVFDKQKLLELAKALDAKKVELIASGGTAKAIASAGIPVVPVEQYTASPEVMGGRVKTLHPKIHAGILADRRNGQHLADLEGQDWPPIDLVVCNLYPFKEVLAKGGDHAALVENIDIGGPTLIRAAAKNADGGVSVVVDPKDYAELIDQIETSGSVPESLRRRLASKAFRHVAEYDLAIANWCESSQVGGPEGSKQGLPEFLGGFHRQGELRYGENPHQQAALYLAEGEINGVANATQHHGKALSYNNYLDLDAAYRSVYRLGKQACAIVKHTNPCGLAQADTQAEAFKRALAGDPVSAFGSVIGFNTPLSEEAAQAIRASKLFVECIVAPGFSEGARAAFAKRENLRLVEAPAGEPAPTWHGHRIGGGLLVQHVDPGLDDPSAWECVTKRQLEPGWLEELAFAMHAAATLKSNAIAITKDRALCGAGAGQMSRVDAVEQAVKKAGEKCQGAFLGSDAFFPFDDGVRVAAKAGVVAVVQPGGSKRDDDVVAACDELNLVMVFTRRRHFRH